MLWFVVCGRLCVWLLFVVVVVVVVGCWLLLLLRLFEIQKP